MPTVEQQVKVIVDTELKSSSINNMKRAINSLEKLKEAGAITNKEYTASLGILEKQDKRYYDLTQKILKYEKSQKEMNDKTKKAAQLNRKLTGSLLGLMFTGMALTRVFGGMVSSVLDTLGVYDMLNATILTVLLPAIEPLADLLYGIMYFFMDLPEPVQKVIGFFVLLAAGIGLIMTYGGMLATGFRAIGTVIMWLWNSALIPFSEWIAGALGVSFGTAAAIIAGVIAAIVLLVMGAIEAWKHNFLGFKDAVIGIWDAIKTVINGFVDFFVGIWNVISGIFTGNTDKIKDGFSMMGEGIKNIFKGIANFIINIINSLVGLIIAALAQVVRLAELIWNKIPGVGKVTWYEDLMSAGTGKGLIPTFQTGGIMPYTGLAQLHKGETVIPAGQTINNAPITINASISNDYDVGRLADQLSKYWVNDMERMSKSRGII